jgi:hypothetical protein
MVSSTQKTVTANGESACSRFFVHASTLTTDASLVQVILLPDEDDRSLLLGQLRALFVLLLCCLHTRADAHPVTLFTIILISLATRAHALNRPFIWAEPIAELPWFGQYPGMEDDAGGDEEGGEGTESRRTSRYGWPQYGGYPAMGMPPGAFWPAQQVMPGGQPVMAGGQPAMMGPQGYLIQVRAAMSPRT